jgi:hypothetical protein
MSKTHHLLLKLCLVALAHAPLAAWAQTPPPVTPAAYRPVTATFSGKSSLSLAPNTALEINNSGTIEFWVAAQWQNTIGYDPAIMAYSGAQGPRFAFHITADRKAFGAYAGTNFQTVPFDFSDGALHHVAVVIIGPTMSVHIDGRFQGTLDFGVAKLPVTSFTIGSIGGYSNFIGEIGQVRIWNEPLDDEVLAAYRLRLLVAADGTQHPNIDALVGVSAFANPESGLFVFFGDTGPVNITQPRETVDDAGLALQPK